MIRILGYGKPEEMKILRKLLTEISIQQNLADYQLDTFVVLKEWAAAIEKAELLDLLVCDVSDKMAVETLVKARKSYREAKIIPIADDSILPSVYVRPDIFPCTLLWKPMETEQNKKAMLQILLSMSEFTEEEKVLCIRTRQKAQYIPYDKIYYIEARDKKLYARTEYQEIGFGGTLMQLQKQLEDSFVRCHKGYLVNKSKILAIDWANHLVQLGSEIVLPISRNCQSKLREVYDAKDGR